MVISVNIVGGDIYASVSSSSINVKVLENKIDVNFQTGQPGLNGWTPVFAIVADGVSREVLQVIDWTGGEGIKPATGKYVGVSGFVDDIADGVNIKGSGTTTSISDQLNLLETALDDVDAAGKGVALNDWYILQEGTDIGFKGQLQKRLS